MLLFKKSSFFYKFVISYIIIFTIPFLVLNTFSMNFFTRVLQEQVNSDGHEAVNKIRNAYDTQIDSIMKSIFQLSSDKHIKPYTQDSQWYDFMELRDALKTYTYSNSFIYEIIYYPKGAEHAFSSQTSYTLDMLFENSYRIDQWTKEDFLAYTQNDSKMNRNILVKKVYSITQKEEFIAFLCPLPYAAVRAYGTLMFLVNKKTFDKMIETSANNSKQNVIILDKEFNTITSVSNDSLFDSQIFCESISKLSESGTCQIRFNDKLYFVSFAASEKFGWSYVTLVPMEQMMMKLHNFRKAMILVSIVIAAISAVLILAFMKLNYKPVQQLRDLALQAFIVPGQECNEIEATRNVIVNLTVDRKDMEDRLIKNKKDIKDYLMLSLLSGDINSIDDFNEKGANVQLHIAGNLYRIIVVDTQNKNVHSPDKLNEVLQYIEKSMGDSVCVFGKTDTIDNTVIILFSYDESKKDRFMNLLCQIQLQLKKNLSLHITAGVSNEFDHLRNGAKAYIEASSALDFKHVVGSGRIIFFSAIQSQLLSSVFYPGNVVETLELYILQRKTEQFENSVRNLINMIKENNMPLFVAKCLCFDIINAILKAFCKTQNGPVNLEQLPDVVSLSRFQTIDELSEITLGISSKIIQEMNNSAPSQDDHRIANIVCFIKDNYCNPDFSVKLMAEHFDMSESNISHYFKTQRHQTISDYLNQLRLEKAKELLSLTESTVREIVYEVGYVDSSSFIKKFRAYTGMTPGEYRNIVNRQELKKGQSQL